MPQEPGRTTASCIAIGLACGLPIGVMMDNIALGIAIGPGLGGLVGLALETGRKPDGGDEDES